MPAITLAALSLAATPAIAAIPDDPVGWGYTAPLIEIPAGGNQQYLGDVRVPAAWNVTKGSDDVTIAVVDTGVMATHADLASRVLPGYDVLEPGTAPDDHGHGTRMAGVAAADTDNGIGISGVAWNARILPVRAVEYQGLGTAADVATGIRWAADHGADVILVAFAGADDGAALRAAVAHAQSRDAVVVASAGDGGEAPVYPAALPGVIAVAATDWDGDVLPSSGRGPWIDVAAPGHRIAATCHVWGTDIPYCQETGTSMAASVVAGVAALVRAKYPSAGQAEVVARILASARDRGAPGHDPFYGRGTVDAFAAVGGAPAAPEVDRGDPAEPNATPADATPVTGSATGTISPVGDEDWYRVQVSEPGRLNVAVSHPQPPLGLGNIYLNAFYDGTDGEDWEPAFAVYGPDLAPLAERGPGGTGDPAMLQAPVSAPGTYYIRVWNTAPSSWTKPYTLSVSSTPGTAVSFAPRRGIPMGASPHNLATGDVTGDGRADILVATAHDDDHPDQSGRLLLIRQEPDGAFGAPEPLAKAGGTRSGFSGLATGDLDGDGDLDAVVAGPERVEVLRNSGDALGPPELVRDGLPSSGQVAVADLDDDGRHDIVFSSYDHVLVFRSGPSGFAEAVLSAEQTQRKDLEVGDLDGDGRLDLLVTGGSQASFMQDATGAFVRRDLPPIAAPGGAGGVRPSHYEVADVTGDGRDDVVVTAGVNWNMARLYVLPQTPDGGIGSPVAYPTQALSLDATVAADLDGDGRADAVSISRGGVASWSLQRADGTLAPEILEPIGQASWSPTALSVTDLNGDGRPDIVYAADDGVDVLLQNSDAVRPDPLWVAGSAPADLGLRVAPGTVPRVRFARAMDPASLSESTIRLRHGLTGADVPAGVTYAAGSSTASLTPATALKAFAPYALTVSGARDLEGRRMPETTIRFRVLGEMTLDVAPLATRPGAPFDGRLADLVDQEDRDAGAYAATVDWGDGTPPTAAAVRETDSGTSVGAGHLYASAGSYRVAITVRDDLGRTAVASTTATVAPVEDPRPEPPAAGPGAADSATPARLVTRITALRAMPARFQVTAVRRSASRRGPVLRFTSSRAGKVRLVVPLRGRTVAGLPMRVRKGANRIPLAGLLRGRTLRPGAHRLVLQSWDGRRWRPGSAVRVVVTR